MESQFQRTEMLIGKEAVKTLQQSKIAVFGIGGVGGFAVEALARSGIERIDIFDKDKVDVTNLNRQIIATQKSIGRYKVDVMKERIIDINPNAVVNAYPCFFLPENAEQYDFSEYNYIIDAVDTITAKLELVTKAKRENVRIISSMGAGNKLDPTAFEVSDIYKTSVCPLAKVMRRELKKRNIKNLKVVYSKEEPIKPFFSENNNAEDKNDSKRRKISPGSIAFIPSVVGLIIAGEVIKDLIEAN